MTRRYNEVLIDISYNYHIAAHSTPANIKGLVYYHLVNFLQDFSNNAAGIVCSETYKSFVDISANYLTFMC